MHFFVNSRECLVRETYVFFHTCFLTAAVSLILLKERFYDQSQFDLAFNKQLSTCITHIIYL